jgi:hypothetical protein
MSMTNLASLSLVAVIFIGACRRAPTGIGNSQPARAPVQQNQPAPKDSSQGALPDPIGHVVDVHEKPWSVEIAPDTRVTQTTPPDKSVREQTVTNVGNEAFVVSNEDPANNQIEFVYFIAAGRCYRIDGIPLPNRPFSGVAWASPRYLVFDRWSQPHYGIHYIVDIEALSVVNVAPFPDQFYLDQQNQPPATTRTGR